MAWSRVSYNMIRQAFLIWRWGLRALISTCRMFLTYLQVRLSEFGAGKYEILRRPAVLDDPGRREGGPHAEVNLHRSICYAAAFTKQRTATSCGREDVLLVISALCSILRTRMWEQFGISLRYPWNRIPSYSAQEHEGRHGRYVGGAE